MKENDLLERTFNFGVNTLMFLRTLPYNEELKVIKNQLIKSSTSVGANYEEAQAASSKADFNNKIKIVLREARESNYWIRILIALGFNSEELQILLNESKELKNIFGAIVVKSNLK
ncbi:four helix bundle protein [Flavobacterium sp. xlx-214]|uniref:four helix bundle protein n=1 Tax=unclassified Flavobacterium TaxID=196869 RepID=UPI0013CF73D5|nr:MULTISPECIES: four helix bundle protein [unclassified Flavobacterium]MBA5794038.1 four helix bundle protein [Flavobacterium sp. xlx-221]QMI83147.1 four helix bundle protein [Flavobacterium sp. xlx-214]